MMDASLPADQSGLSDLSAASILSDRHSPRPSHPSVQAPYLLSSTSDPARIDPSTPMSGPSQTLQSASFSATPGPSRFSQVPHDTSGNAWTPSPPDTSLSPSNSKNRSTRTSSFSVKDGNESMGSSLGTFDFSNASFSESFLRQAGAHMLAGLDEAHVPPAQSSSSSPRYRTSSSPTVTARPIRSDPRTPFTGKSLRTRMLEAGIINSPTSSDGSSPSRSPTTNILPDSYADPSPGGMLQEADEDQEAQAHPCSPLAERFQRDQPSSPQGPLSSPSQNEPPWSRNEIAEDSVDGANQTEWQEGLSMVPEESYVEDASQLHSSPAVQISSSQRSLLLACTSNTSVSQTNNVESEKDTSNSSAPAPEVDIAPANHPHAPTTSPSSANSTHAAMSHSSEAKSKRGDLQSPGNASPVSAVPAHSSPQPSPAAPATPQSVSRKVNTPKSLTRLRMVTPARSSPLSRVVNFSPSSAGGSSQWQSPASQQSTKVVKVASPSPGASVVDLPEVSETRSLSTPSTYEHHAHHEPAVPEEQSQHPIVSANVSAAALAEHHSRNEILPRFSPQTPNVHKEAKQANATPPRFWSPATSASFATPASQRPAEAWSSAPATPVTRALPQTPTETHSVPPEAISSPAAEFGTPQWTPSPAPVSARPDEVKEQEQKSQAEIIFKREQNEEEEPSSSSTCSSASEKKQSGDFSSASQPAADQKALPLSPNKEAEQDLSLVSAHQLDSSPSAARFSRMQLSRIPPSLALSQLPSVPELGLVANAFDSLTQLSDSRVSRLLAQLSASMTRVEELEAALDARDREVAELDEIRYTLSQLSVQYQELVADADEKDAHMAELVKTLQSQIASQSKERSTSELESELEEERRMREIERRDFEVRMQGLLNPVPPVGPSSSSYTEQASSVHVAGDQMQREVEQAKEQLRLTLEKDFEIRRAMEQRELQQRVKDLERELASKSTAAASNTSQEVGSASDADAEKLDLQRQNEHLTAELDRRFEELSDLREDLESLTTQHDAANDQIIQLEEALAEAQSHPLSHSQSHNKREEELEEQLETLRENLAERESQVYRLEETLTLTISRLTTLTGQHDELMQQHESAQSHTVALKTRVQSLESHILNLEQQLRAPVTPAKNGPSQPTVSTTPSCPATNTTPNTPASDRVTKLEREIASLNLELLKLGRANDALQEDNVHFSIALSAKQLELGMVKRNARFALKNAHTRRAVGDVGLPVSKKVAEGGVKEVLEKMQEKVVDFPSVPKTQFGAAQEGKENRQPQPMQPVNQARQHARQLLAQRRTLSTTTSVSSNAGQERRQRLALTAQ